LADAHVGGSAGPATEISRRRREPQDAIYLEWFLRLFARAGLWTLLIERRRFNATFIAAAGAIVSEMISSASVLLAFPTNLKKRNAAAFCASNPSRIM
jgi:hypothetical protein